MYEVLAGYYLMVLPMVYIGAQNGIREYLSLIVSGIVWMLMLGGMLFGNEPAVIPVSIAAFGCFLILSVLWSIRKESSIFSCLTLLSCLTAFVVIQKIDRDLALLLCFLPSAGIAGDVIYEEIWMQYRIRNIITGKKKELLQTQGYTLNGLMGNANHTGIYLASNVLIGMYLSTILGLWIIPFVLVILIGIFYTRCRNAQAATLVGICSIFLFYREWWMLIPMAICSIWLIFKLSRHPHFRDIIFKKAVHLIWEKPFFGWGLDTFRMNHNYRKPFVITHRVHNDYLEFIHDIGLIGFTLFSWIFFSVNWSFSPVLSAQLVIILCCSFWFFSFREIHTSMPIWCLLAVLIPASAWSYSWMALLLMVCLPYILWVNVGRRIIGLYWYAIASRGKTVEQQYENTLKAIEYDQDGKYMSRGAVLAGKNREMHMAWDLAIRTVYNYDGGLVLASVYDQVSRIAMIFGAVAVSDFYNKQSLELHPEYQSSVIFAEKIKEIKDKMGGLKKCTDGNA